MLRYVTSTLTAFALGGMINVSAQQPAPTQSQREQGNATPQPGMGMDSRTSLRLGTALVFIPALFAMLFVAGAKIRHLAAIVALASVFALITWFAGPDGDVPGLRRLPSLVKPYQRARVAAMFSNDPKVLQ